MNKSEKHDKSKFNFKSKSKSDTHERFERKRYLNVIYFIDSNRTRTLKFSIGASYLTVGLLSAAVIWSIISTSLLLHDRYIIAGMSNHTKSLLELVFNQQTRYDEVYEKAYPDNDKLLDTHAKQPEKEQEKSTDKHALIALAAKRGPAPAPSPFVRTIESLANPGKDPPLSIDNFSTTMNGQSLLIHLSLKNLSSPNKTSGSVSATAKFVDQAEKSYSLESHPRDTADESGSGEHFNIRYFKNKAFFFEPPKDVQGRFLEVVVTIKDAEGRSKDFFYPLNKEALAGYQNPNNFDDTDANDSETDDRNPALRGKTSNAATGSKAKPFNTN